ncbi:MAG: DUF721 domain-containing protein [Gammaproteobacteria bacterium]|nr:DUF721 domain-containing protein [Gammaproteobacteria bacterium]
MKRPFRAKSVADSLTNPEGELKALLEKANRLNSVAQTIEGYLPAELQAHCKVASVENNVLTLITDSAVWLNRLRYFSSELMSQLRAHEFPSLISIDIKVRPDFQKS